MQLTTARRRAGTRVAGAGAPGADELGPNGAQRKPDSTYAAIWSGSSRGSAAGGGAGSANSGGAMRA